MGGIPSFYHVVKHKCKINTEIKTIQNVIPSPNKGPGSDDMQRYYRNIYLEGLNKSMKTLSKLAKSQTRYQSQALVLYHPTEQTRLMGGSN